MVLGLIVYYIMATSSVPENNSTLTHTSAYKPNKKLKFNEISNSSYWYIQCISILKIWFPSIKTTCHVVSKLKLKLSSLGVHVALCMRRIWRYFGSNLDSYQDVIKSPYLTARTLLERSWSGGKNHHCLLPFNRRWSLLSNAVYTWSPLMIPHTLILRAVRKGQFSALAKFTTAL